MSICILIQVFAKTDTLEALWMSLRNWNDLANVDLIVWQDSPNGSRKEIEYSPKARNVTEFVEKNIMAESWRFRSVTYVMNERNRGTCKTCELALNYAFSRFPEVIFTEDDTIFSREAVDWFLLSMKSEIFKRQDVWAVAGESVYFDSHGKVLPDCFKKRALEYAIENELENKFRLIDFIPSTCFATNKEKWGEFGRTRGQPNGDADVCVRCKNENKYCIFPIVPRVIDVGMLHPDGYSVMLHTPSGVRSIKSTYLTIDDFPKVATARCLKSFEGHGGELWRRTVLLEGFGNLPPW